MKFAALTGVRPMIEKFPLAKVTEAFERAMSGHAQKTTAVKHNWNVAHNLPITGFAGTNPVGRCADQKCRTALGQQVATQRRNQFRIVGQQFLLNGRSIRHQCFNAPGDFFFALGAS